MRAQGNCGAGKIGVPTMVKNLRSAVFLHIQKTAGTTIVNLARSAYGNQNIISHGDYLRGISHFPLVDELEINDQVLEDFRKISFLSGHFGYDFAKHYMPGRYSFTFLRDPIERVLSLYYFCRKRDPDQFEIYRICRQSTLNGFLKMGLVNPEVRYFIWNNQVWQLACGFGNLENKNLFSFKDAELLQLASNHLDDFSYIGFAETFEADRDRILRDLGIVAPEATIISNANPGRPTVNDLPQTTKDLLFELTELDGALYKKAWSKKAVPSEKGCSRAAFGKYDFNTGNTAR
jgi:hypothetical protein